MTSILIREGHLLHPSCEFLADLRNFMLTWAIQGY